MQGERVVQKPQSRSVLGVFEENKEADRAGTECGGRVVGGQRWSREPGYIGHLKGV